MEEVTLTEPETRFYSELFQCCDVENTGKVPMLKATELFRSADIANETVIEITGLAGIPGTALHISRAQFYSCLKLIAAHQAAMPLRQELIAATVPLPLPHFSWKEAAMAPAGTCENGLGALPPPPPTDRRNSLRRNSQQQQQQLDGSDVPSTDSEVEQNESSCGGDFDELAAADVVVVSSSSSRETRRRGAGGSPEAWSTNSDSPTPTNSVAERPWAQDTLWQGLLGDEHRQLLGTEEESSDRHSSDDDDNENELITLYQITAEQREYYNKQFRTVQRDPHGLLSGQAARIFFEKSRIPVEELRHIWQLCDVTRDGALSLSEFTAAMHLVVLRRNNIPLPSSLPHCLHPNVLATTSSTSSSSSTQAHIPQEPPEADLLHLNDDDDDTEHTDNTIISSSQAAKPRPTVPNDKNIMNLSSISTSSQASNSSSRRGEVTVTQITPPPIKNRSISNSPNVEKPTTTTAVAATGSVGAGGTVVAPTNDASQWTKFSESPTTTTTSTAASGGATGVTAAAAVAAAAPVPAVSSPGLKPALFDMKRTAQDVGSNPQILHPVPLRVTPIGTAVASTNDPNSSLGGTNPNDMDGVVLREESPKAMLATTTATTTTITTLNNQAGTHRDRDSISMQSSDLRAIQRPQAKKLPAKNIGALPPPPQREPSIGSIGVNEPPEPPAPIAVTYAATATGSAKKEPPPLPPPRPHRHARSSSLDLNKFKIGAAGAQQPEITAQASFDMQTSAGFADFTHFADDANVLDASGNGNTVSSGAAVSVAEQQQHSLPPAPPPPAFVPPTRISLQHQQRISAFEVYRKPQTPAPVTGTGTGTGSAASSVASQLPNADSFEKRVTAISDSLRHVSFKQNSTSTTELLQRLREQNNSLLHLCNDLSDELLSVQTRKEEMRLKLERYSATGASLDPGSTESTTISNAPVTANVTGGSSSGSAGGGVGAHTNV